MPSMIGVGSTNQKMKNKRCRTCHKIKLRKGERETVRLDVWSAVRKDNG